MHRLTRPHRWIIASILIAFPLGYGLWLVYVDASAYRLLVRLYVDKHFLKQTLREWGILAPVLFMVLQALQVIISPIPGEATGFLGGYLFGEWLGLLYSTIGLTVALSTLAAFALVEYRVRVAPLLSGYWLSLKTISVSPICMRPPLIRVIGVSTTDPL